MRIGELAEAAGTTTRALRHYEAHGLLESRRAANSYRDYSDSALLRVRNIRQLLAIGFTIGDIRWFLDYLDRDLPPVFADGGGCTTAMRIADQRLAQLRERIDALTHLHDQLAARLAPTGQTLDPIEPSPAGRAGSPATWCSA
jgi:DNA-binding transcriptional MerR regulator